MSEIGQPGHFAKNAVVTCIDDRLFEPHVTFIRSIGGAFQIALAGGGLPFLLDDERDVALNQVAVAYKVNKVIVESHTDCGRYGLAGITFASPEDEVRRLYSDLSQAAKVIQNTLIKAGAAPGEVEIVTRVVRPDGTLVDRPDSLEDAA